MSDAVLLAGGMGNSLPFKGRAGVGMVQLAPAFVSPFPP